RNERERRGVHPLPGEGAVAAPTQGPLRANGHGRGSRGADGGACATVTLGRTAIGRFERYGHQPSPGRPRGAVELPEIVFALPRRGLVRWVKDHVTPSGAPRP